MVITYIRGLMTPLITTHEPPSIGGFGEPEVDSSDFNTRDAQL